MSEGKLKGTFLPSVFVLLLFALSAVAVIPPAEAANSYTSTTLSIGGSTLIAPMMSDWQTQFNAYTGGAVTVNYQAVGSTTGTNNMLSDIFSLGFSDAPIPANGLATINSTTGGVITPTNSPPVTGLAGKDPLIQIPDGLAPVSVFYNIPSFRKNLNLTGDIIAEIFLQHITAWNAPQILAINKGLTSADVANLAKYPIQVVHRSDGSGTSFALTYYMGHIDGNWTAAGFKAGSTSSSNFPATELSAKGSGGVAGLVSATNGAIGYAETAYAVGAGLPYAAVLNADGTHYVLPTPAGATAAAAADASQVASDPEFTITNAPGATSYPISTYTYVFVWENQNLGTSGGGAWTQGTAYDTVQFLNWIVTQGQSDATLLQYAPIPPAVVQVDLGLIAKVNFGGASFLSSTATSVTCNHASVIVGKTLVSCTAVVSGGSSPSGSLLWTSTGAGTFSRPTCPVPKSGKCVTYFKTSGTASSETIAALYVGDLNNAPSIGSASLAVTQATSKVTLLCTPSTVKSGATTNCKATVTGFEPSGKVSISQTGGTGSISAGASCALAPLGRSTTVSVCTAQLTGSTTGSVTLNGSYGGDVNNLASTTTKAITVH
ncbi:MAG TPA: phosphate ABC transporter substrate-binding protein PstS [Nitrososphaerales archaeon]|nr:phosphate ABC transporter substrate-binding protein PstS [Nitrososphaerales archaeon]